MTRLMPLAERVEEDGIRATVTYVDHRIDTEGARPWPHNVWRVTLRRTTSTGKRRQLTTTYKTGESLSESDVTAVTVLSSMISDTVGYDNATGFPDWCSEYGYDSDSIKARATYDAVKRQADQLYRFLGTDFRLFVEQTDWQL